MSFADSARKAVEKAADDLEAEQNRIGIMRSLDATRSAAWLGEIVAALRAIAKEDPNAP